MEELNPKFEYRNSSHGEFINTPKYYNKNIYLITPKQFNMKFKTVSELNIIIKNKGENYGDALTYNRGYEVFKAKVYKGNKLHNIFDIIPTEDGQFTIKFDEWSFMERGSFKIEFELDGYVFEEKIDVNII